MVVRRYDESMKFALLILLTSCLAVMASGCSTPGTPPAAPVERQPLKVTVERPLNRANEQRPDAVTRHPPEALPLKPEAQTSELLMYALSMIGVKYKYGGSSMESGFDCSGFVRHVYGTVTAIDLPRNAQDMSKVGSEVRLADLAPGDLVFYNTLGRRFSHVGIYIGGGRFVHAPSERKSVETVDMNAAYWKRRFNGARRLLVDSPSSAIESSER